MSQYPNRVDCVSAAERRRCIHMCSRSARSRCVYKASPRAPSTSNGLQRLAPLLRWLPTRRQTPECQSPTEVTLKTVLAPSQLFRERLTMQVKFYSPARCGGTTSSQKNCRSCCLAPKKRFQKAWAYLSSLSLCSQRRCRTV